MVRRTGKLKWWWLVALVQSLITALVIYLILHYQWWVTGSPRQFEEWHPNFGIVLWGFKVLVLILCICLNLAVAIGIFIYLIRSNNLNRMWIGTLYFLIGAIVGEVHPFTTLPMYKKIRDVATVFYLEDGAGKVIPLSTISRLPSAFINKAFSNYLNENGLFFETVLLDSVELNTIGSYVFDKSIDSIAVDRSNLQTVRLKMVNCNVQNPTCDTITLHERTFK